MTDIAGRVAIVTGGGSGVGRALALALAHRGADVAVADLWEERSVEVAGEIDGHGGSAAAIRCDVSDPASVAEMHGQVSATLGEPSLLFANAGVAALEPLAQMERRDVAWVFGVNLMGVVHCLEEFLPEIVRGASGHVVATSSVAGLIPESLSNHGPYAGSKAGLIGLMLNLRLELALVGVGCTVVCPGGVVTRIGESGANRPERFGGPTSGPMGATTMQMPQPVRFRPADEVARMILQAVEADQPMVITDASQREYFLRSYVDLVLSAFDRAADFDAESPGGPEHLRRQ
jgi:NAD(P)-dependent dehydrogenase (short-subunit alcohol dehydrogenase family)